MQKELKDPKLCNDRGRAFSWHKGKRHYFGVAGTPEAKKAYKRFCAKLVLGEPVAPPVKVFGVTDENNTEVDTGTGSMLVSELADAFLKYHEPRLHRAHVLHSKNAIGYLVELYGSMPVNEFSPKKLRSVRGEMVKYGKLCRKQINSYTTQIVRIWSWGVEEEWVDPRTAGALKFVKHLPPGEPGTFDHPEREDVPFDVIKRTLPFMSPTVRAMVVCQFLTGMRPSEVCKMTVGSNNRSRDNGLWYFDLEHHKTKKHIGKKVIPLSLAVQELLVPYLSGKKPGDAVFSPRTAMREWYAERRANRKSKIPPSQQERDRRNAENPRIRALEFYDRDSYRIAVANAIKKGNKVLPEP